MYQGNCVLLLRYKKVLAVSQFSLSQKITHNFFSLFNYVFSVFNCGCRVSCNKSVIFNNLIS